MTIRVNDLKNLEVCENSFFLNKTIVSTKNMYYYMAIAIKTSVTHALNTKDFSEEKIKGILNENMPNDMFLPLVKETNLNLLTGLIIRYLSYLKTNEFKVLDTNITEDISVEGQIITISADLILEDIEGAIHVVKLKRGAPKLSYAGRKHESIPRNNVELYALKKLGDKKYSDSKVFGSFHHMEGKNDDKDTYSYEAKKGYNIINCSFDSEEEIKIKISELIKRTDKKNFDKTLDESNCRNCQFANICNYKKPTNIKLEKVKEEAKAPSNFELTKSQLSAVLLEKGISRINAGAGSGKTTVVALRVNELILAGCEPKDILMTTFTNKGAQEMRDKVRYWLGEEGQKIKDKDLNITTFNAWGDDIIKENYEALGFKSEPKLVEKVEKYDILFKIFENNPRLPSFNYKNPIMNFRYAQGAVSRLEKIFNFIKANNIQNKNGLEKLVNPEEVSQVLNMYKQYGEILKEKGLIEYQDQINMVMTLMEEGNSIMDKYDYKHIITDEFQDTDAVQIDLIMYLSNQPSFESLMVVGDDSQSIFGFRNTTQENILNFHNMFNEVKDIQIMENFRSTPQIVHLANYVNSLNKNKIDKKLISGAKEGQKPCLLAFESADIEHREIALKIKSLIDSGDYQEEDIAVIARTKYELFDIQNELEDLGVPQILDIPEPIINNITIHMAKNLTEFIDDTNITQGLYEYLMILTDNFESMDQGDIAELMKEEKENIEEIIKENLNDEDDNGELIDSIKSDLLLAMIETLENEELNLFIDDVKNKNYNFAQTKIYLRKFIEYEDPKTIDKDEAKYKAVTLTTAHTSKGKEFEVVFNTITKYQPDNTESAIEEERRLLFVSITRAKKLLYVTFTQPARNNFSKRYNGFPKELYDTNKTIKALAF